MEEKFVYDAEIGDNAKFVYKELSEIVDSGNLLSAISHILTKGRSKNIIIK